jgi:Domain of unknown function (DUF4333)
MPRAPDLHIASRPDRRTLPHPPIGRFLPVLLLIGVSLLLSACGSSGSASRSHAPKVLNTAKVARAIQQSSLSQRGEHAKVSCPTGVRQQKGLAFSCTALVGSVSTRFVVTQLDGNGDVHYEAR